MALQKMSTWFANWSESVCLSVKHIEIMNIIISNTGWLSVNVPPSEVSARFGPLTYVFHLKKIFYIKNIKKKKKYRPLSNLYTRGLQYFTFFLAKFRWWYYAGTNVNLKYVEWTHQDASSMIFTDINNLLWYCIHPSSRSILIET